MLLPFVDVQFPVAVVAEEQCDVKVTRTSADTVDIGDRIDRASVLLTPDVGVVDVFVNDRRIGEDLGCYAVDDTGVVVGIFAVYFLRRQRLVSGYDRCCNLCEYRRGGLGYGSC